MAEEQRTEEWFEARRGKITASSFADAMAFGEPDKTGYRKPLESRGRLMRQLAFERTSGKPKQAATSKSMNWGKEVEDFAREAYEIRTGVMVRPSGFVAHPLHPFIGASPDGRADPDGGCEIKCPYSEEVHILTMLEGMPEEHIWQVQGNMMVTGAKWWDFISFDPRQKERYQLYVERIERDDDFIQRLETGLLQFEIELQAMVKKLDLRAA